MFTTEQIEQIVTVYNDNRDADASRAKVTPTLTGARFLEKLYNAGYTYDQIIDHIIAATASQVYKNIYDLLTTKSFKNTATTPAGDQTTEPTTEPAPATEPTEPARDQTTEPTPARSDTTEPGATPTADPLTALLINAATPAINAAVKKQIESYAATGAIEKPLTIITPSGKVTTTGKHELFEQVLSATANGVNLYLYGPAGSGKNVICKQVADALNLEFYYTNNVMQEHQLKGYSDAYGKYHDTPFYNAFKNGGLFMLDELDASIPQALTIINAAISNGYFVFGNGEQVTANANFHVIAAGNTLGTGATTQYARNRLDAATLNRFNPLFVDYSRKIENTLAPADVVEFCRDFRKACKKCGIEHVTSYRNIISLNQLSQIWDIKAAVKAAIIRELSEDDINMLRSELDTTNKYAAALYA